MADMYVYIYIVYMHDKIVFGTLFLYCNLSYSFVKDYIIVNNGHFI